MPQTSQQQPFPVACEGGLIKDTSVLAMPPGACKKLENFEPSITGGYRRINGFTKYDSNELSGSGSVLGVQILGSSVIAARGANLVKGTGSGWTDIVTNRTSAERYSFTKYRWANTEKIAGADGTNQAFIYDGSTYTLLSSTGAPSDPHTVEEFRNHLFFTGANSGNTSKITFSAPYSENDFTPANGAGEIDVGDKVVGLKAFRDQLYIFCENSIFRLAGTSMADFQLAPVSRNIGCTNRFSIQEVAGDVIFLAPDGIRTVAATEKIGDVELGTISKAVQSTLTAATSTDISSLVIREKTQYRLFFPTSSGTAEIASPGLIGVLKRQAAGDLNWEWADIRGIKPYVCTSDFIGDTEYILHGGYDDGYIYKQESGNNFNGGNIPATYTSPDLTLGDPGIRKLLKRININYEAEGTMTFQLAARFDYEDVDIIQPAGISVSEVGLPLYGSTAYGSGFYGGFGTPILRQLMVGSGFAIAIRISQNNSTNNPFIIRGFELDVVPGGRR